MIRNLLKFLALGLGAALAQAAPAPAPAPVSGIDTQFIDPTVRAQDDFFQHVNGQWLKLVEIPPGKSSWGSLAMLHDNVLSQLREVIESARADEHKKPGSDQQKVGDLYASFMDQAKREALGYRPLTGELQRIRRLRDKHGLPALIAHLQQIGVSTPYSVSVRQDARDATKYAAYISQSGLGLPERDYYLNLDDPTLAAVRDKYQRHIARLLTQVGNKDGAARSTAILALETALAEAQWTLADHRDPVKHDNRFEIAKIGMLAPGYDWRGALAAAGVAVKTDTVIVSQPSYLTGFERILGQTDLATWKAYFEWHLLRAYAGYLSDDFVNQQFAFYGTTLTGASALRPRWERGVAIVDDALGDLLAKQYVARHFPPESKARMQAMVQNLLAAFQASIHTLDSMSADTKQEAQAKLAKLRPKIGYPNQWRDYSALEIARIDLVGNLMRARAFAYRRQLAKLGQPVAREEWDIPAQTVNAHYTASTNDIVVPAALLQRPLFDMQADDAVNYGAIGAVIGHEISHGFDDTGSLSDADGKLRDWWSAEDRTRFNAKAAMLATQYSAFSALPGYQVNGELTLRENIADNAGLAIAYKAYLLSLGGQSAPVIDGMTGQQRFFMGFAQLWRAKVREAQQIVHLNSDPHAPGRFRVNGTLKNQPGFHDTFGVKPGDQMYLAPSARVTMW